MRTLNEALSEKTARFRIESRVIQENAARKSLDSIETEKQECLI